MNRQAVARGRGLVEELRTLLVLDGRPKAAVLAEAGLKRTAMDHWRSDNLKQGPSLFSAIGLAQALGYELVLVKRK